MKTFARQVLQALAARTPTPPPRWAPPDPVTVAGKKWWWIGRHGPGCWHPDPNGTGRCLSWQGLLDHAYDAGWGTTQDNQDGDPR